MTRVATGGFAVIACMLALAAPGRGVVVRPVESWQEPVVLEEPSGLSHVGTIGGLSGVYLGHGWVLTAAHVIKSESPILVLSDVAYPAVPESLARLESEPGVVADLQLFRLEAPPDLPPLRIARRPARRDELVTMVGNGWQPRDGLVHWGPDWREADPARAVYAGFAQASPRRLRWGRNVVTWTERRVTIGQSMTRSFQVRFDATGGPRLEATSVSGDSGGAAFVERGGRTELLGILFARSVHEGQPGGIAAYGNVSEIADLSFYRDQIRGITRGEEGIDPGVVAAAGMVTALALLGLVVFWRRRRSAATDP